MAPESFAQLNSGFGTSGYYSSSGLCVIVNWSGEGGRKDHFETSSFPVWKGRLNAASQQKFQCEAQPCKVHNFSSCWRLLHSWIMDGNLLTCLLDKFHASFWRTGNKAVSKIPSREFPSIDATQAVFQKNKGQVRLPVPWRPFKRWKKKKLSFWSSCHALQGWNQFTHLHPSQVQQHLLFFLYWWVYQSQVAAAL